MVVTKSNVIVRRLHAHRLAGNPASSVSAVVTHLGALQAQDYEQAKFAVASRTTQGDNNLLARAIARNVSVRTWLLRGTLHLVNSKDVRWILAIIAPRILKSLGTRQRELGLTDNLLMRANELFSELLSDGKDRSRKELTEHLSKQHIAVNGEQLYHLLLQAALRGIICCAPENDRFRLLPLTTPASFDCEDALARLAETYYRGHGPATETDLAHWSGMPVSDCKLAIAAAGKKLQVLQLGRQVLYDVRRNISTDDLPACLFLAGFDEYYLGYKDKSIISSSSYAKRIMLRNGIFNPIVLVNGEVAAIWKRTFCKDGSIEITIETLRDVTKHEKQIIRDAAGNTRDIFGVSVTVRF